VRRVSLENNAMPGTIADLNEIAGGRPGGRPFPDGTPIMGKEDITQKPVENEGYILLKSGGSSGKAIYAPHTYSDAEMTYVTAGRAMFAAGIKPGDVCMNLFYSGSLYGGFISIYEGLKHIDAIQLPMAANMDFAFVAEEIVSNHVTVIMGMPSYLLRLFSEQREILKNYGGIRLTLYGGEQFDPKQIAYIKSEFGVSDVRSLVYGCNEIGSIGYVCEFCQGTEHHLFSSKYMEILKMDVDEPVKDGETGRIVLSNIDKENIDVNRYEIGDLGRFVTQPCPCGRSAPKFELKGRFGDIFKFASNYVNYALIKSVLAERLDYMGNLQIVLEYVEKDTMRICVDREIDEKRFLETLIKHVPEINETFTDQTGTVVISPQDSFVMSGAGGKVRNVVDMRI
jgi:phenylacetate-coenzyme A ligase PaaK-like adenylate-forming protein